MAKNFTICLVKSSLFCFLMSLMICKDASSAGGPQCEIICKLSGSAKDEETVDPDSKVPFNCSIRNGGATTQNTTWKQLYRTVTAPADGQPCMVLKTGNSERQIYLARALTVAKPGSPRIIYENIGENVSCEFEGRPRPFITWSIGGKSIKSEFEELSHTELETSQDDGIFKVTSTLYIPGRKKFHRLSFTCSGTNNLTSGWSSSARETIAIRFKCKDVIKANGPPQIEVTAFNDITLRCLVSRTSAFACRGGFTWHFNKNPEPLKTNGKYVIVKFEDIKSECKEAFSLEILNVTEDDEGEYSCHQRCRTFTGWHNQSGSIKMKVYSPSATTDVSTTNEVNTTSASNSEPSKDNSTNEATQATQATRSELWIPATVVISVVGGVFVLVFLSVTWSIKKKRAYKGIKRCAEEGVENDNLFISYSSKDFSWVSENLISLLEKHSIPYIIHIRDFELGRPIVQNMADSVYNSRQVVIVLSNNYLASNFCREELHMALQRGVDTGYSALVLVSIDKLKKKQLPNTLRNKTLLDFERHKKQDWEKKLLSTVHMPGKKTANF
ncbi:uncharacterized protein [Montipora capricornis]|uniref:uncharacterized protein isoform X2 n=1 Tax=Montipora capricornis TaxID=246305 RepID=UPI0035F20863